MEHNLHHSTSNSALKVPDGLLVESGISLADASIRPQEVYDGGLGGKEIRLRIANGGAGLYGFIGKWANAFIQYYCKGDIRPFRVAWYRGGTTESLGLLAAGLVDIAVTYNDGAEKQLCRTGGAVDRVYGFRDHFYLVGPKSNPANLKEGDDILVMFNKIVDQGNKDSVAPPPLDDRPAVRFLSRFDKSGTNIKESGFYCKIGQVPWALAYSKWYHRYPTSPPPALSAAAALQEYTMTDRGTWLFSSQKVRDALTIFAEGKNNENDPLLNPAHVLLGKQPKDKDIAEEFMRWVKLNDGGQKVVREFKKGEEQVYYEAPADKDLCCKNCE